MNLTANRRPMSKARRQRPEQQLRKAALEHLRGRAHDKGSTA